MNFFRTLVLISFLFSALCLGQNVEGGAAFEYQGNSKVMMEEALSLVPSIFRKRVRGKVMKSLEDSVKGGKVSEKMLFDSMCKVTPSMFIDRTVKSLNKNKSEKGTWTHGGAKDL